MLYVSEFWDSYGNQFIFGGAYVLWKGQEKLQDFIFCLDLYSKHLLKKIKLSKLNNGWAFKPNEKLRRFISAPKGDCLQHAPTLQRLDFDF